MTMMHLMAALCYLTFSSGAYIPLMGVPPKSRRKYNTGSVVVRNTQKPWDDGVDYDKVWGEDSKDDSILPTSNWDEKTPETLNLGLEKIDILTAEDTAQLKKEAKELLERKVKEGIDDINKLRKTMNEDIGREKRSLDRRSQRNMKEQSTKLFGRIDAITDKFLGDTKSSRDSTKLAAAADRSMEGKGLEYGAWGEVGGYLVMTNSGASALLGSIDAAKRASDRAGSDSDELSQQEEASRVLIIADESSDKAAKFLLPTFKKLLQDTMDSVEIEVIKPTQQMPLGGNDAAAVIFFLSSITTPPKKLLERLLRRTMGPNGSLGSPPSQFIAISQVGTERTNVFPYSMQNFMGGKLDNMRLMEESLINAVKERVTEPSLDYTIVKFGEIKESKEPFAFEPGDVLDGTIPAETAAEVLLQAIAFQPSARNATLCAVGNLPADPIGFSEWDDYFLKLVGPELLRINDVIPNEMFIQFGEYLIEWAMLFPSSGKLVTPCRYEPSSITEPTPGVMNQFGVKLVFQPTKTGTNYFSKDEERQMEAQGMKSAPAPPLRMKPQGGVEVLLEILADESVRIRARRCNMGPDTVVKELSEETILSRLEKAVQVFAKDFVRD